MIMAYEASYICALIEEPNGNVLGYHLNKYCDLTYTLQASCLKEV